MIRRRRDNHFAAAFLNKIREVTAIFKDIKLIATDMDGTFVKKGAFELAPEDFDLIRALKSKGIIFAAASGRPYGSMRRMFAPVAGNMMFICDNGCNIMWQGKNIYLRPMNREACFALADYVQTLPEEYEGVMCTIDSYVMMPKNDRDVLSLLWDWNMSVRAVERADKVIDDVVKFSIFNRNGISAEFSDMMKSEWGGRVPHITASCREWLDFQDGDKGDGLRVAAERLGIPLAGVAAFGDSDNDIEMLKSAGYSYAMTEAAGEVKACAGYECADVRDVLRELLAQQP